MMNRFVTLFVLVMGLLYADPSEAALSVVQRVNANSASSISSLSSGNLSPAPVVGHLLVVLVVAHQQVSSITDTIGNTFTEVPSSPLTFGINYISIHYAVNVSNSTDAVTASFGTNSDYTTITVFEVSGNDTSSPFVDDDAATQIGADATITTGTLSLSGNTSIIFGSIVSLATGNGAGITGFTGYTVTQSDSGTPYVWDEYHVPVSSNEAAGATTDFGDDWAIIAAAFKEGTSSSSQGSKFLLIGVQ